MQKILMTHQFSSWFEFKINFRCATVKHMRLFHEQNKFGLRNILQAIVRYSEEKTQLNYQFRVLQRITDF